jgi:hypothetical protein
MVGQGVYKFYEVEVSAERWNDLWLHFTQIRAFYRAVADYVEGVLVVLD